MRALLHAIRSDLATYQGDWSAQGFWALAVHRFGAWRYGIRMPLFRKLASLVYKCLFKAVQVMAGIELPCEAEVGPGCRIDHFGGIIVSGHARIGEGVVLRQGVTVGLRHVEDPVAPRIGDRVDIGAGAKLLGPITIGDDAVIGANAVVIEDVPGGALAVGVPAQIRPRRFASVESLR